MDRELVPWRVARDGVDAALPALAAALDGSGPALEPVAADAPPDGVTGPVPEQVALVLRTSGSTGEPRRVLLDGAALRASADATHERLGGPGRWVLALPPHHVAGVQVLVRSLLAGTSPLVVPEGPWTPEALASAVSSAPPGRLYVSLVPTQLHRVVAAAAAAGGRLPGGLAALARLDAVLVGGAAAPEPLVAAARDLGLRVVVTYGMTETCGGCVYDGVPLAGVRVALGRDGAVRLAGPVLARGYLPQAADEGVFALDGDEVRWLLTRDLGALRDGRLEVLGRVDDVLVTGGVNVAPAAVEACLAQVPGVAEVCVVGVPDDEWGTLVTAVVVPVAGAAPPDLDSLRDAAGRTLGSAAAPRRLVLVDALPLRGPGKVDRSAAARLAAGA